VQPGEAAATCDILGLCHLPCNKGYSSRRHQAGQKADCASQRHTSVSCCKLL